MPRMIDQIRASKLPSNMMQFAARGALSVPPAESIEIMVYLAKHNKVFGDLARMTLAGWDEKSSLAAAADPNTPREVLDYLISPENLRPKLLPALLENPSLGEGELTKFALSASADAVAALMKSGRVRSSRKILESLRANPYLKASELKEVKDLLAPAIAAPAPASSTQPAMPSANAPVGHAGEAASKPTAVAAASVPPAEDPDDSADVPDDVVSAYLTEHSGTLELLGADYFPVSETADLAVPAVPTPPTNGGSPAPAEANSATAAAAKPALQAKAATAGAKKPQAPGDSRRENALQKINRLDVKGRIQLALKGNKEERSLLIRDGTKVVALAVLEAPKLADGEVEKFASQKNVLEAVLRAIPLKRRFMKNYIVVRNLVFNPRTPIDLSLGLIKNLLIQDLKNLAGNKEVSETIRKLGLKMYKQKLDAAAKK